MSTSPSPVVAQPVAAAAVPGLNQWLVAAGVPPQPVRAGAPFRNAAPVPAGGTLLGGFARNVVSYLQADDAADGSLLAFFTDADTNSAGEGAAWAGLLRELELALEAAGLPLRDAWIVGPEFWRNAYCSDPVCCAPPGRPVEQIRNSRLNAEMVFRGSSVGVAPGVESTTPTRRRVDPAVCAAESGWTEQFSLRWRNRAQFAQVLDVWTMVLQEATVREHPPVLAPDTRPQWALLSPRPAAASPTPK